jgi:hypothetical protein
MHGHTNIKLYSDVKIMAIIYVVCEICFESSLAKHTVYPRWICIMPKKNQSVRSDGRLGAQSSLLTYFNKHYIYEVMTCCAFSWNWTHEERTHSCLVKEGMGVTFACKNENEMEE